MKTKLLLLALGLATFAMTAQHDDSWELQNLGYSVASRGTSHISVVDSDVVWINAYDGSGGGATIRDYSMTSDGGTTWNASSVDVGDNTSGLAMIHGVSADLAYAAVYPTVAGGVQGVFQTTDGGTTWNRQDSALYGDGASFINVVYFWDENNGFAQGDPIGGQFELYTTTDGGANWVRVPVEDVPNPIAFDEYGTVHYFYTYEDTIWWTTTKGRVFKSNDKGYTWEAGQSPVTDSQIEIAFNDENQGYMVNDEGLFWTTTDGGMNWALAFPDGLVFGGDLYAFPNSNVVMSLGIDSAGPYGSSYSTDAGLTFTTICDTEQHNMTSFAANDATAGWSGNFSDSDDSTLGGVYHWIGGDLTSVGIEDIQALGFVGLPNPVVDTYSISALENITNVSVYNVLGQEVYSVQPNAISHHLDMSNLPHGTYIVNITIGNVAGSVKVIK